MSLMDSLMKQLTGSALDSISQSVGADKKTTGMAMAAALPALLGALAKNTTKGDGAEALNRAIEKDHDGSILDNLSGFLGGDTQTGPGAGILKHVLGGSQPRVESGLSKATGMDAGSMGKLLVTLAPIVMGALGSAKKKSNLGATELAGLLGDERNHMAKKAPNSLGGLERLLDSDGDGDVDFSDFAKGGGGLLGKLLGG